MMPDGTDVDRIAAIACDSLGLVTPDLQGPDGPTDEIVIVIHIAGGLLADVGARREDAPGCVWWSWMTTSWRPGSPAARGPRA